MNEDLIYLSGFGNIHHSEAIEGALPTDQNSPKQMPYGLYAEQLSGSAFTQARKDNLKTWMYRIQPSVVCDATKRISHTGIDCALSDDCLPTQYRWFERKVTAQPLCFFNSLEMYASSGNFISQTGVQVYTYLAKQGMQDESACFYDGELLIVPQEGVLNIRTEFGLLEVKPKEIAVIPKGIVFQVALHSTFARGYVLENFGAPFVLPELGPIGANGLANPRHFLYPTASYIDERKPHRIYVKNMGKVFMNQLGHNPYNVVAFYGNYLPYKYDLTKFNTINTVSFDHPDPSIFTVLTSPSSTAGLANCDFVIFPSRWMVAKNTFRPPYFHRNLMSECMGLIEGQYDAKSDGFNPGGLSIHNSFCPHGPDQTTYVNAVNSTEDPQYYDNTLAFMFESRYVFIPTEIAMKSKLLDSNYTQCWQNLYPQFTGKK